MAQLKNIKIDVMALVDKPANLRPFLLLKSKTGGKKVLTAEEIKKMQEALTEAQAELKKSQDAVEVKAADIEKREGELKTREEACAKSEAIDKSLDGVFESLRTATVEVAKAIGKDETLVVTPEAAEVRKAVEAEKQAEIDTLTKRAEDAEQTVEALNKAFSEYIDNSVSKEQAEGIIKDITGDSDDDDGSDDK